MSTCYLQPNPYFKPCAKLIWAISNTNPLQVTTTTNHEYLSGTIVRLTVPKVCGMPEVNEMTGQITVTGLTTFTMPIDASTFESFAIPVAPNPHDNTCALVIPIGESSDMLTAALSNVL